MKLPAALAALVLATAAHAGPCPSPQAHVTVLGAPTTIDQGGGIVAGVQFQLGGGEGAGPDQLAKLDWTLGGKAPKVTLVAPDLGVLAPAAPGKQLVLEDGKHARLATVTYAESLARLATPAPAVKSIAFSTASGPRSYAQSTVAQLASPPPATTVAVLFYKNGAQAAGKLASGWAAVNVPGNPKATQVALYASSRCAIPVGGGEVPNRGDKLVLVWLAADGTLSKPSAEYTVK